MSVDDEVQAGDEDGRGFDPRFDPAFQRGYRPRPGEQTRTRMRGVPTGPDASGDGSAPTGPAAAVAPGASAGPRASGSATSAASAAWEAETVGGPATSIEYGDGTRPLVAPEHATAADRAAAAEALPPAGAGMPVPAPGASFLDRVDTSPRTNRRVLALWIIGAGLVVLGIVLYVVSVFTSYTNPTPNSDVSGLVFSQLGWMLAGPLVTVGLATLVTMTLLTAVTARRPPARGAAGDASGRGDESAGGYDD